jgi:hypothetical protein
MWIAAINIVLAAHTVRHTPHDIVEELAVVLAIENRGRGGGRGWIC